MGKPLQPKTIGLREMESLEALSPPGYSFGSKHLGYLVTTFDFSYCSRHLGEDMALALIVLAVVVAGCFLVGALTDRPLDYIPR